jgi:hypothetical protein
VTRAAARFGGDVVADARVDVVLDTDAVEDVEARKVGLVCDASFELLHAAATSNRHVAVVTSERGKRTGGGYASSTSTMARA